MNSIYIESEKIQARKDIVEWLDGCGATWALGERFSEIGRSILEELAKPDKFVWFNHPIHKSKFSFGRAENKHTHCQTPEQFCELIAESLGIDKPVFGEVNDQNDHTESHLKPIKGIAIEVSRLSEDDKKWLKNIYPTWNEYYKFCVCSKLEGEKFNYIDMCGPLLVKNRGYTITDSPKVFMEYVAQQAGKEYMSEPVAELRASMIHDSLDDGPSFGDIAKALGVDDDSWKLRHPSYPHKTYRILDSLDGIPLDKRFKLSEWIPPMEKELIFIDSKNWAKGKLDSLMIDTVRGSYARVKEEGQPNLQKISLDGEWMRIV